jgi:hypothetical protein
MSTNDDSASRRGRRADQAEPDWRAASRSGNQYPAQNPRDSQAQNAAYSGFSRQQYSQQPYAPPHQEPAPPALPQQGRSYDTPQGYYQDPAPQMPQQSYYQEPAPRLDPQRGYVDPASPYAPPQSPYDSAPQQMPYGGGSYGAAGGELFGRDPSTPQSFDQNPYAGTGYRPEVYEPAPPHPAQMQAPYAPRAPQESSTPQYYLPEEPQRGAPQPAPDRGYLQQQALYSPASYDQPLAPHESYQRGGHDPHFPGDALPFDDEMRAGRPPMTGHPDDFDEEFPDEDFDHEDYGVPQRRGRKKLFAALLLSAAAVVVGGTYGYKTYFGGKGGSAPPLIKAEMTPSKEAPADPGGKQYPHGEKAIYERLTPDGRTQVASAVPSAAAVPPAFTSSPAASTSSGSSLEDRIDEALKRAQNGGDTSSGGAERPTVVRSESYGPDGRRLDARPVITPNIVNVDSGNLPYPFGRGSPAASPDQPQFATRTAPAATAQIRTAAHEPEEPSAAVAVPAPSGSFYVSLRSAPDEEAIRKGLPALAKKYRDVLGDVQLSTKLADLGSRGVTYRAVAGPLETKQEAMDLCTKIKGVSGDKACFVTN